MSHTLFEYRQQFHQSAKVLCLLIALLCQKSFKSFPDESGSTKHNSGTGGWNAWVKKAFCNTLDEYYKWITPLGHRAKGPVVTMAVTSAGHYLLTWHGATTLQPSPDIYVQTPPPTGGNMGTPQFTQSETLCSAVSEGL